MTSIRKAPHGDVPQGKDCKNFKEIEGLKGIKIKEDIKERGRKKKQGVGGFEGSMDG